MRLEKEGHTRERLEIERVERERESRETDLREREWKGSIVTEIPTKYKVR